MFWSVRQSVCPVVLFMSTQLLRNHPKDFHESLKIFKGYYALVQDRRDEYIQIEIFQFYVATFK